MATAKCYAKDGNDKGNRELPDGLFAHEINEHVVHEAVRSYLANQRQGNASTKERSDVRGGGSKPFRQKGTGRARAGTSRSPIWKGGGVVFGPHPRDYSIKLPKKVKRLALLSVLSAKAGEGNVIIVEDLDYPEPKTKIFCELLKKMESYGKKILFVSESSSDTVIKSSRNIQGLKTTRGHMVNTYDVLWADKLIITERAIRKMEEVFES